MDNPKCNCYFNVKLELDKAKVDQIIHNTIENGGKGYVCSVERNIITNAYYRREYRQIVNDALVNILDGAIVGLFLGFALKKKLQTYVGADLFLNYIRERVYRFYFLGNTEEVLKGLRNNLTKLTPRVAGMKFKTLPFENVEKFDYQSIGDEINKDSPDIIWVSLGAPKQEVFMSNLLPYLNRGILFGFGAIFNFYSGIKRYRRAPKLFLKFKLEWLYRIFQDPKKNIKRNWDFLKLTPRLVLDQKRRDRKP